MAEPNGQDVLSGAELDDAKTPMAVSAWQNKKVVLHFDRPMLYVAIDPPQAVQVGKHLIDCAVTCGQHVEIKVPRREISREQRDRLVARATLVYTSMVEKRRPPKDIAREVVDSILSEVA